MRAARLLKPSRVAAGCGSGPEAPSGPVSPPLPPAAQHPAPGSPRPAAAAAVAGCPRPSIAGEAGEQLLQCGWGVASLCPPPQTSPRASQPSSCSGWGCPGGLGRGGSGGCRKQGAGNPGVCGGLQRVQGCLVSLLSELLLSAAPRWHPLQFARGLAAEGGCPRAVSSSSPTAVGAVLAGRSAESRTLLLFLPA